jgi:hypothetical protein
MKTDWLAWLEFAEIYFRLAASWFLKIGRSPVWRRMTLRK